jgi:hypothetical protein
LQNGLASSHFKRFCLHILHPVLDFVFFVLSIADADAVTGSDFHESDSKSSNSEVL